MKMFLLTDSEDTLIAHRLAGIEGVVVSGEQQFRQECERALCSEEIGILFVGRQLTSEFPDVIPQMRKNTDTLICSVPDMGHVDGESDWISRYVKQTIGM